MTTCKLYCKHNWEPMSYLIDCGSSERRELCVKYLNQWAGGFVRSFMHIHCHSNCYTFHTSVETHI